MTDDPFEQVYDEHHARLYRIALLVCHGDAAAAEDAVAEAFVDVHQAWIDGAADDVLRFARDRLVDLLLGRYRDEHQPPPPLASVAAPTMDEGAAAGIAAFPADADSTFAALARLPVGQRVALVLRFYEDLPYEQIASAMSVSVGSARSHVSVGVRALASPR